MKQKDVKIFTVGPGSLAAQVCERYMFDRDMVDIDQVLNEVKTQPFFDLGYGSLDKRFYGPWHKNLFSSENYILAEAPLFEHLMNIKKELLYAYKPDILDVQGLSVIETIVTHIDKEFFSSGWNYMFNRNFSDRPSLQLHLMDPCPFDCFYSLISILKNKYCVISIWWD